MHISLYSPLTCLLMKLKLNICYIFFQRFNHFLEFSFFLMMIFTVDTEHLQQHDSVWFTSQYKTQYIMKEHVTQCNHASH